MEGYGKINWQEVVESGLEGGSSVISTRRGGVGFSLRARRVLGHHNLQQTVQGYLLALSCSIYMNLINIPVDELLGL